jgi:diguanylate cyclase (GGDEF)-like protein
VVEGWHRSKDGSALPVQISLSYAEQDHTSYLISVTRDITEQKRQQEVIERLARMLRMQSAISSAVLRIRDRDELLREACRLATHLGGYDRAVVSLLEPDGRTARPRFRAGSGTEFPEPDVLEIADGTEPDTSLTSRALRTGEIVVCNDIGNPESPVAMRERLLELGFKTVLALPLLVDGRKVGALTLTSRDPTFVTDDELLLLQDMAASLSFALRSQEHADAVRYVESYDSLTGLAKRPLFCQRFDAILSRIAPGRNPAIAAFDVHLLSSINDTFGRRFGDLLLQSVAERLRRNAESEAHVGYLGGGTFVLVEPELFTSAENISWVLDETVFGEPFSIEGREIRLSCRSGVARFPMDGRDSDTLLQNAEAALKRAKDVGEPYLHYKLEMHSEIAERLALEHRLRRAVDAGEFEVRYQPQLNIATGRIDAVEALLRWNDPEHGLVSPAQFLPVLESSGLIVPAGNWILARAVADCRAWQAQGLGPVRVSVNVSPLQLRRRMFVAHVLECLRGWPTRGGGYDLDLEITETALFHDMESSSRKLQELRAAGIRIALDDFGTGYSSLGLLSTLPVDILKIDRAFVRGLPDDRASVTLARSIVALASAFGLESVAEGVETPEQLQLLREMHCSYSQGYLHYPALRTGELEQVLASQAKLGNTGTAVG